MGLQHQTMLINLSMSATRARALVCVASDGRWRGAGLHGGDVVGVQQSRKLPHAQKAWSRAYQGYAPQSAPKNDHNFTAGPWIWLPGDATCEVHPACMGLISDSIVERMLRTRTWRKNCIGLSHFDSPTRTVSTSNTLVLSRRRTTATPKVESDLPSRRWIATFSIFRQLHG
jgi:hypothetical protein